MEERFDPDEEGSDEVFVPDEDPMASDDVGVTVEEQLRGPGLDRRLWEEQSDRPTRRGGRDQVGQLSAEGDTEPDEEEELVATEEPSAPGLETAEEEAIHEVPEGKVPGAVDDPGDGSLDDEA